MRSVCFSTIPHSGDVIGFIENKGHNYKCKGMLEGLLQ